MKSHLHTGWMLASLLLIAVFSPVDLFANTTQDQAEPKRFEAAEIEGVTAMRDAHTVYLTIEPDVTGPINIPRLAAPLRSMRWQGSDIDGGLILKPEQETWELGWKHRPEGKATLVLDFDAEPLLPSEVKPTTAFSDGSFYLPAHLAMPRGEKIRYEPQPFKNTVGYWTGGKDTATWYFKLEKPGRFTVAILQGCGKGQGGSTAKLSFARPLEETSDLSLGFTVEETGHFQNFRWRHLGEVELKHASVIYMTIAPDQIKKNALMDIRAVHLIRLPD